MNIIGLALLTGVVSLSLSAQTDYPKYWISFTDKDHTPFTIEHPGEYLSLRALERREKQNIPITVEDLPVDPDYLLNIEDLGIRIINVSKWFNGAMVEITDTSQLTILSQLSFVEDMPILIKPEYVLPVLKSSSSKLDIEAGRVNENYGPSFNQVNMLRGDILHDEGYRGQGMLIAVLDAGFTGANVISSLQHLWQNDRIVAVRDFVKDGIDIYSAHNHGTIVSSIMAGIQEGMLVGTAPEAEFMLVRTEDAGSEFLIEEYNWICGAEYADSMGADIINSSLGYSLFDDPSQDHSYSDLDGETVPISRAAEIASSRGMVVVTSAGNEGGNPWFYITAPGDADNIITVGAVDSAGYIAGFSSRGPSYDRRVKPDVCTKGYKAIGQRGSGEFVYCSGTSCSSPVMAGMTACLWQANPSATNLELIDYIQKSGDRYFHPDSIYGYGIPNLVKSTVMLTDVLTSSPFNEPEISLFPNPANESLYLKVRRPPEAGDETLILRIFDSTGNLLTEASHQLSGEVYVTGIGSIYPLVCGIYFVQVNFSGGTFTKRFSKL